MSYKSFSCHCDLRTNTGNRQPFAFILNKHVIKTAVAIDAVVTQAICVTIHKLCTALDIGNYLCSTLT